MVKKGFGVFGGLLENSRIVVLGLGVGEGGVIKVRIGWIWPLCSGGVN